MPANSEASWWPILHLHWTSQHRFCALVPLSFRDLGRPQKFAQEPVAGILLRNFNIMKAIIQTWPLQRGAWPGCHWSIACWLSSFFGCQGLLGLLKHSPPMHEALSGSECSSACTPALPLPTGTGLLLWGVSLSSFLAVDCWESPTFLPQASWSWDEAP